MKLAGFIFGLIAILFVGVVSPTYAHPGRTAADGCHYCRTNCEEWGVPYDERHCDGGESTIVEAPVIIQPIAKPVIIPSATKVIVPTPTPIQSGPTKKPIPTVSKTPISSPTEVVTPTPEQEVSKVQSIESSQTGESMPEEKVIPEADKNLFDYFIASAIRGMLPQFTIFRILG